MSLTYVPPYPLSRRRLLQQFGLLLSYYLQPAALLAQTVPEVTADGFRVLRAGQKFASQAIAEPLWTYDGGLPGPLLRAKRGEELKIRLVNGLAEATAIHWHGVRLPNAMDGAAPLTQPAVAPGGSFDYRFAPPDAGTFWYHASTLGQRARGLAGVLIVDETEPPDVSQEFTLVFQDARRTGTEEPVRQAAGALQVNGALSVDIPVRAGRLRLRLINATLQLLPSIRIGALRSFVMAIDGEPAEPFTARDSQVALGPGNRIDMFVDVRAEEATVPIVLRDTADAAHQVARLLVQGAADAGSLPDPRPLSPNPLPARMDFRAALKADVALPGTVEGLSPRPLFSIPRERTAMLALVNGSDRPQIAHVHGHHFRLLDRLDDGWKPFWLDTVLVPPRETQRISFVADNPGKWLIDCHAVADAKAKPPGWFEVR